MNYGTEVMKIPILFLLSSVFLGTNGDVTYVPKITDSVFSCEGFDNDMLNCDGLKLGSQKGDDGDDAAKLSGDIITHMEVNDMFDMEIDIWKMMMEDEKEFMTSTRANVCASLQDPDAPWAPIVEALNITGCPISPQTFTVEGMTVALDAMKDVLCHDFCGEYQVKLSFIKGNDKMSCHVIELCIVEESDEDKE
ncbi:hypothetical protein PYW08_002064 [Mythimna loreyi]|uniref:Uncharacterized protein n=1 Tax=Mythimna loreyi TaxID=667449 RepID=A0ACC2R0P3_9NEOP|nr:hypothetical protein PYW08_002064 [Mythimna loreyi]